MHLTNRLMKCIKQRLNHAFNTPGLNRVLDKRLRARSRLRFNNAFKTRFEAGLHTVYTHVELVLIMRVNTSL